ncbi:polyketide synthase [Moniliophthora roreri MCA 2997]|uniref:Polyketide synthase n=1 Tax=Moniliophthora roreri (strain MCA 2997) TaxID=1381753 RepID=V2WU78_MONRO|nr:polyketide synthase [Moniliophthora roreri MCA 2997]
MIGNDSNPIYIPIFAGQGSTGAQSSDTFSQAIADSRSPSGSTLLASCHHAFHNELLSLSSSERQPIEIDLQDFPTPVALLSYPHSRYRHNPIISSSSLFLIQSLRYLAFVESESQSPARPDAGLHDRLHESQRLSEILGFSSGILPACLIATSLSTITYLSRAVELYRLALWVSIRAQIYRVDAESRCPAHDRRVSSWSVVFLGLTPILAQEALDGFAHIQGEHNDNLVITAVADTNCVTISGRPDILRGFTEYLRHIHGDSVTAHETRVHTLYHSPALTALRQQVIHDVSRRKIKFPSFEDIVLPFRSSFDGAALKHSVSTPGTQESQYSASLLHAVVDMLLLQPVSWDRVASGIDRVLPEGANVRILNFGPGGGVASSMERMLQRYDRTVRVINASKSRDDGRKMIPKHEPIAIVGMAVNLPGAPNVEKLWEVLEKGLNTISEIPEQRLKVSNYDGRNPKRQMKAHTGNFIDGADEFDNRFFKISPREAKSMDPQQRILLHTAYEALEDSGYVPYATPSFSPETFGCYVGATAHDYVHNLRNDIDVYYSTGTLNAFLCGRVSYVMQLSGPSIVVDTACSSSSVAFYQACRALVNGDCNAALVGGVNIISSPDLFLGLDRAHFLSPTGQCQAFDASADGYSRSEGCGMFVLKRLSDAVADNDNILGTIRGVEMNQSGQASSITHPHSETQTKLFKNLLANAGVADPSCINVVEAHGTGTQAGDPNELESIRRVLCVNRTPSNPLHVTSIKANIGHVETASGAAGLAKLLLMIQHQTIPPQISLQTLNPSIAPLETDHTIIDRVSVPWLPSYQDTPRMALLNNFGAAGSNVAMLVEEHQRVSHATSHATPLVCGLSAKDETAAEALRQQYLAWLQCAASENCAFADIAYTMTARRQLYPYRTAVCASSKAELAEKLQHSSIQAATAETPEIVFMFSGQGGQYLGMGQALYETFPVFRYEVDQCHSILLELGFPGVLPIILARAEQSVMDSVGEQEAYQASVFALEYALGKLWMSWGVTPSAVIGHSLGEYAALVFAEVLSLHGALTLVAHRARLMFQKCQLDSSGMITVNLPVERLEAILTPHFPELSIACYNSPVDCVVAGSIAQLSLLKAYLDKEVKCKSAVVNVPFGYHSQHMTPILSQLGDIARQVVISPPTIPISSNVLGLTVYPGDATVFDIDYFGRHCAEPVQFDAGIRLLAESCGLSRNAIWIEVGPHPTSLPLLKSNPVVPGAAILLPSMRKKQDPCLTLMTSLSLLYARDVRLGWREIFSHVTPSCISLPSYPFSKQKFWVPYVEESPGSMERRVEMSTVARNLPTPSTYTMANSWIQLPSPANGYTAILETPVDCVSPWIMGHRVGGLPLCPASVYMEMALCAVKLAREHTAPATMSGRHTILRNMEFVKPLIHDSSINPTLNITVTMDEEYGSFTVTSKARGSSESVVHAKGDYRVQRDSRTTSKFDSSLPEISQRLTHLRGEAVKLETLYTRMAYGVVFPRVVDYGCEYHGMEYVSSVLDGTEGYARVDLPANQHSGTFVAHPVLIDCLLHVSGFIVNMQSGGDYGYICHAVGSLKMIPALVHTHKPHMVYCRITWSADKGQALSEVWARQADEPHLVVLHAKDVKFKRVRLNMLTRGLTRAAGRSSPIEASQFQAARESTSKQPTERAIPDNVGSCVLRAVWETCGMEASHIDLSSSLDALGVDSLMSIELMDRLKIALPEVRLDPASSSSYKTIADLVHACSGQTMNSDENSIPLVPEDDTQYPPTPQSIDHVVHDEADSVLHIRRELATALNVPFTQIHDDTPFDSLGLDSLASIEVLHELKVKHHLELPNDIFTKYTTLKSLKAHLSPDASHRIERPSTNETDIAIGRMLRLDANPILYQTVQSSGSVPIYLIHDGSGLANYYERLYPLHRAVWAIHNPRFLQSDPWKNLMEMTKVYADFIISTAKSGPVIIGGWSFGSVAAYETAVQIRLRLGRAAHLIVKGLLLIDPPNPVNHVPMSGPLVQSIIKQGIAGGRGARTEHVRRLVQSQFSMNARLLGEYDPLESKELLGKSCLPIALLRSKEGYRSPYEDVPVPDWLADRSNLDTSRRGWEDLTGELKVWDIPGNHFEPFQPGNIETVSACMLEACGYIECQST